MPRDDTLTWYDRAMAAKRRHYYSAHNVATRVNFEKQASLLDSNRYDADRIFVDLSWELQCWWQLDRVLKRWRSMGRQKHSELHHPGDVLVNAWRRSWWCSQSLRRLFLRAVRFDYYLHYTAQFFPYQECNMRNNFSPTRSVVTYASSST